MDTGDGVSMWFKIVFFGMMVGGPICAGLIIIYGGG
jgi:hypothetical protein